MISSCTLADRARARGGKWGVRALRLALASKDPDGSRGGRLSADEVAAALCMFGLGGVVAADVQRWLGAEQASYSAHDVMHAVVGAVDRDRLRCAALAYSALCRRFAAATARHALSEDTAPTARFVVSELNVAAHPDVRSGAVTTRDAIFCLFCALGLPRDARVSQELFLQYHADLGTGFGSTADFVAFVHELWGLTTADAGSLAQKGESVLPALAPDRQTAAKLFAQLDGNGSGRLSLAECDLGVVRLWPQFNFKPAVMRAFKLALSEQNRARPEGTQPRSKEDDFLDHDGFYRFLHYLVVYSELAERFKAIDTSGDGRLSLDELLRNKRALGLGDALTDVAARALFKQLNSDGGTVIRFEEFAMGMAKLRGDAAIAQDTNQFGGGAPKAPGATAPKRMARR